VTCCPIAEVGSAPPVLAEVVRSGFVESRHRASLLAVGADGADVIVAGAVDVPVFPRSANKPLQAAGMLDRGLDLDGPLLALACASHSGEPAHVAGVRRILAGAGLDESALQTPPDLPLDDGAAWEIVRAGGSAAPVYMNCSGKHAAMLATCVVNGWDLAGYRAPGHPLQRALRETVEALSGQRVTAVGVDGCGAPVYALSLRGLARAFVRVAGAAPGTPPRRVADAMTGFPAYVGGSRRDVTQVMAAVPGLVAKDGAEGVFAAALPDGRAVALKVEDGASRPRAPLLVFALRGLGVNAPGLDAVGWVPVLGHGTPVGYVRVVRSTSPQPTAG
jgi:L-asparaginase II